MITAFIVAVLVFSLLSGLADLDKLIGTAAGARAGPAFGLFLDVVYVAWCIALLIARPW